MTSWLGHGVFEIWAPTWSGCGGTVTLPSMRIELLPPPQFSCQARGKNRPHLGQVPRGHRSVWLGQHQQSGFDWLCTPLKVPHSAFPSSAFNLLWLR